MPTDGTPQARDGDRELALSAGQRLLVQRQGANDLLRIVGRDGGVTLTIQITEQGPILRFAGADIAIQATGTVSLEAERLALHGRAGLTLSSGGELNLRTDGDLHSVARLQHITATRGNVSVRANDDVKLNGERVLVNC